MYTSLFGLRKDFYETDIRIEFQEIKLTQLKEKSPQFYSGKGIISKEKNKSFDLILFPNEVDCNPFKDAMEREKFCLPNRIIQKEYYFEFEGSDIRGNKYTSNQVIVSGEQGVNGVIIKGVFERLYIDDGNNFDPGLILRLEKNSS